MEKDKSKNHSQYRTLRGIPERFAAELLPGENVRSKQEVSMETPEEESKLASDQDVDHSEEVKNDIAMDLTPASLITENNLGFNAETKSKLQRIEEQYLKQEVSVNSKRPLRGLEAPHLCNVDFRWLKGDENERAIFWVWVYIRNASAGDLFLPNHESIGEMDSLYHHSKLPEYTSSTEERSRLIVTFFDKLSFLYPSQMVKESFEYVRAKWLHFINPVRQFRWIKKTDEDTIIWAQDYLLKRKEINGNALNWFTGADLNEKYISIMGAVDCWVIRGDEIDRLDKKRLLEDMYRAYKQRSRREKNEKFILNAEVSVNTRSQLKEFVGLYDTKINKFIEALIDEEYQRYKNDPAHYQPVVMRKRK